LARRLVERGVPFVEVTRGGWATHTDNFNQVKRLSEVLDPAWAALMSDLKERGLLDSTLIVWMGEFGRTPKLEGNGRNHYPNAWSTVLAGGGIKGGQAYGKTSADGTTVEENPVSVPNFIATVCAALGIAVFGLLFSAQRAVGPLIVFAAVTIVTIVVLTLAATRARHEIPGQWLERWGNAFTALVRVVIGVLVLTGTI